MLSPPRVWKKPPEADSQGLESLERSPHRWCLALGSAETVSAGCPPQAPSPGPPFRAATRNWYEALTAGEPELDIAAPLRSPFGSIWADQCSNRPSRGNSGELELRRGKGDGMPGARESRRVECRRGGTLCPKLGCHTELGKAALCRQLELAARESDAASFGTRSGAPTPTQLGGSTPPITIGSATPRCTTPHARSSSAWQAPQESASARSAAHVRPQVLGISRQSRLTRWMKIRVHEMLEGTEDQEDAGHTALGGRNGELRSGSGVSLIRFERVVAEHRNVFVASSWQSVAEHREECGCLVQSWMTGSARTVAEQRGSDPGACQTPTRSRPSPTATPGCSPST